MGRFSKRLSALEDVSGDVKPMDDDVRDALTEIYELFAVALMLPIDSAEIGRDKLNTGGFTDQTVQRLRKMRYDDVWNEIEPFMPPLKADAQTVTEALKKLKAHLQAY